MAEPITSSGAVVAAAIFFATTTIVVTPGQLDLVALGCGSLAAAVCYLLTRARGEDAWARWGWTLLTMAMGGMVPRSASNRGWVQESYSDFGLIAILSGMLIPVVLCAVWISLGQQAPKLAEGLVKKGGRRLGVLPESDAPSPLEAGPSHKLAEAYRAARAYGDGELARRIALLHNEAFAKISPVAGAVTSYMEREGLTSAESGAVSSREQDRNHSDQAA